MKRIVLSAVVVLVVLISGTFCHSANAHDPHGHGHSHHGHHGHHHPTVRVYGGYAPYAAYPGGYVPYSVGYPVALPPQPVHVRPQPRIGFYFGF
jgi:hypothetical protein